MENELEVENKGQTMNLKEKVALVEISPYQIRMTLAFYMTDSFEVFDEYSEALLLHEDIDKDGYIKPTSLAQCRELLKMYRKLCENLGVTRSVAYATCAIRAAKNHYSFLDEMELTSGFKFKLMSEEDEIGAIHSASANSIDASKAVVMFVSEQQTKIVAYSRRTIVGKQIIPFGFETLKNLFMPDGSNFDSQLKVMTDFMLKQVEQNDWFGEIDVGEIQFIGMGELFEAIGKLSRKGRKYSLDMPHAYSMTNVDLDNVCKALVGSKLDKSSRIKGISKLAVGNIISGIAVISAIMQKMKTKSFMFTSANMGTGFLFKQCVPATIEKPLQDILGYSLETNVKFYQPDAKNGAHVFELAMLLFKQLRVMHRLPRMYVKPLKIASYLYNSAARMRFSPTRKEALNVILHSRLFGATHRDLVIAAFVAGTQFSEEFSLPEWVRYKDIVTEEDLQAIRFLSVLVRIATCFDLSTQNKITDIVCDVLGDSVIIKTVTEHDITLELRMASQVAPEFKHVFGKTLELL